MRKCKHYNTFGLPRWEDANTTSLLDSKDEKMQTLHHFWIPKMRKCRPYTIFGIPRWENANTTQLLDSKDEKMQTLHHFCTPKMRKCKHYITFGLPRWENANTTPILDSQDEKMQTLHHFGIPNMRKCKHYTKLDRFFSLHLKEVPGVNIRHFWLSHIGWGLRFDKINNQHHCEACMVCGGGSRK